MLITMVNCMDIHDEMFGMGLTECYECNDSLGPSLDMVTVIGKHGERWYH